MSSKQTWLLVPARQMLLRGGEGWGWVGEEPAGRGEGLQGAALGWKLGAGGWGLGAGGWGLGAGGWALGAGGWGLGAGGWGLVYSSGGGVQRRVLGVWQAGRRAQQAGTCSGRGRSRAIPARAYLV
jgi:hypothetical protein